MAVTNITNVTVRSMTGTQVLTGANGEYDPLSFQLWVVQEGSTASNGGPEEGTTYTVTFTRVVNQQPTPGTVTLPFLGRFAGVGYEFKRT